MPKQETMHELPAFAAPEVGTTLAVLSALSILFVCMLLPMVGAAGANAPFAAENTRAFTFYVLLSLALSIAAIQSKMMRRKIDGSPLPRSSFALCGLDLLLLIALYGNLLKL